MAVLEDSTRKRKTSKAAGQLMRARAVCYLLGLAPHRDSFPARGDDELESGALSVPLSALDCTLV